MARKCFRLVCIILYFRKKKQTKKNKKKQIQYNPNSSNMDGWFTVEDSNFFFSPYKILPIAQENKYLGIFSYFILEMYVVFLIRIASSRRF